ncbi:hypothetical protein Q8W71_17950 [Methylobacterium sp. NEAU 140]|uniref:hypothetical protein n=1 Tax=Methylobacterium sp. NEAU 140 TaxID=3064945 RepID=UPI002736A84C|nr:hypothetical protein [Methylobacterium sp. NEAU 140]MDP4024510.1 hypothetical protein [Methylobacterium sp. NEAU 140]
MKLATLACLAALCLTGLDAHAAPGDAPRPEKASPSKEASKEAPARPEPPRPDPAKADPAKPAAAGTGTRRRRSYAACNRASHQRGYYGGRRRRFLIRCRLGYERTRLPPAQVPGAAAPHPGRRP